MNSQCNGPKRMDQGQANSHGHISYEDFIHYHMSSNPANLNSLSNQHFYEEKTTSLRDLLEQKRNTTGGGGGRGSITRESSSSSLTRSTGKLGSLTTGSENSLGNVSLNKNKRLFHSVISENRKIKYVEM